MDTVFIEKPIAGDILYMVFDNNDTLKEHKITIFGLNENDRKDKIIENEASNIDRVNIFDEQLNILAKTVFRFLLDEDSDSGDSFLFLGEIDKQKSILENELKNELSYEQYREYNDNLYFLEGELNRRISMMNIEETHGRGGR